MEPATLQHLHTAFEDLVQEEDGVTYWYARDIQPLLEYTAWRNFVEVIEKAKTSCIQGEQKIENHFVDLDKMVDIGSDTQRPVKDYKLTRYACYLIAQNGDPRKTAIAFSQSYFALQTRKQEILEEQLELAERLRARTKLTETEKQLSRTLYEHGVDDTGFGIVRSRGDNALFGGHNTGSMKQRLSIKTGRALADFLPTVTLKAKEFAAAITSHNVKAQSITGIQQVGDEHVKNNQDVRAVLAKNDIQPENLPPAEDIKKLERRVKSQAKQLAKTEGAFSKKQAKNR